MKKSFLFQIALAAWLSCTASLTAQNAPAAQTTPPTNQRPTNLALPRNLRVVMGDGTPAAPAVLPAALTGFALAFARAIG